MTAIAVFEFSTHALGVALIIELIFTNEQFEAGRCREVSKFQRIF